MIDMVQAAINSAKSTFKTDEKTKWQVVFADGVAKEGLLSPAGGAWMLSTDSGRDYFVSSSVIRLSPYL